MTSYIESHTKKRRNCSPSPKRRRKYKSKSRSRSQSRYQRLHTIEKDQTGIKEEGQNPQGIRDGQSHCHFQYLQEFVQKYVPKQDPQGIIDAQGHCHIHCHVQYLQEGVQKYVPKQGQEHQ